MGANLTERVPKLPGQGATAARSAADRAGTAMSRAAGRAGEATGSAMSALTSTGRTGADAARRMVDEHRPAFSTPRGRARGRRGGRRRGGRVDAGAARVARIPDRAGRKVDSARAAAELSAERARHAGERTIERTKSRRAIRAETKARQRAERVQLDLEKRLAKAERRLARAHRRRRVGAVTTLLVAASAGAAATWRFMTRQTATSAGTRPGEPYPPAAEGYPEDAYPPSAGADAYAESMPGTER